MDEAYSIDSSVPKVFQWVTSLNSNFMYYFNLTVIPIGLVLNLISILVFARKEFKKTTIGFYNIIICLVNIFSLIFLFIINYQETIGKDILTSSSLNCTAFSFIIRMLGLYPPWLQIMISLDRLVCISHPLEYKELKHKKLLILITLLALFCILFATNIPNIYTKLITEIDLNKTTTIKYCAGGRSLVFVRDLLSIITRLLLPFILLVSFNSVILYKLIRLRKEFSNFNSFMVKEYKFTISTLVLNLFYLVALALNITSMALVNTFQYDIDYVNGINKFDRMNRLFYVSLSMFAFNYICNFMINIRTNIYFRKELVNLLKAIKTAYDGDGNNFLKLTKNGLIIPWGAKLNANGDIVFK